MELKQISKLAAKLERLKEERKQENKNGVIDHAEDVPEKDPIDQNYFKQRKP